MSFAISDIKAGYLLRFTAPDGTQFNASVHPAASYDDDWGTTVEEGDLICRTQYTAPFTWIPVTSLSEDLTYTKMYTQDIYPVDAIYGYAPPPFASNCTTTDRRCLWQRTPPKAMTIDEISAELGYDVILLEEGVTPSYQLYPPRKDVDDQMMVILRNGTKCLIVSDAYSKKYVMNPSSPAATEPFAHYNDEFRYYNWSMRELDIMEIWSEATDPAFLLSTSEESRALKWKRNEGKYMTLDQICTALGYLVTITGG